MELELSFSSTIIFARPNRYCKTEEELHHMKQKERNGRRHIVLSSDDSDLKLIDDDEILLARIFVEFPRTYKNALSPNLN